MIENPRFYINNYRSLIKKTAPDFDKTKNGYDVCAEQIQMKYFELLQEKTNKFN